MLILVSLAADPRNKSNIKKLSLIARREIE
jgi:hypothetical protein